MRSFKEPTFDDLFPIYIYTTPRLNRIMQDPNIKIIPVIWPILEYHLGVIMVYTLVNVFNLGKQPRDIEDQTFEVNHIENMTSEHREELGLKTKR